MDDEIGNFVKIWVTTTLSASYIYLLSKTTNPGPLRLFLVFPVAALFVAAPLPLSSCHLGGGTWFFLTWLGLSKLLLFSAGAGPLSRPGLSLPLFSATLLLPIKLADQSDASRRVPLTGASGIAVFGIKVVGFFVVIGGYNYRERMSGLLVWGLCCCHLYLSIDIMLFLGGAMARSVKLAPQVDDPYFSTSLQDFWGRRWNLMVSDILRQTTYNPIRNITSPHIGNKLATLIGVLASFLVSGLMHEWVFCYLTRVAPTWEVTWFFVLHGACLVIELLIKSVVSHKWRLQRAISGPLTIGFVVVTATWLFFPPLMRNNVYGRIIDECAIVGNFVKRNVLYFFISRSPPSI